MMSSSAWDDVSMTTGMCLRSGSLLMSSSTSRPSRRGRLRSSKIRSGVGTLPKTPSCRRNRIASSPSLARCMLLRTLLIDSASRVSRASPGLSSTSRISIGFMAALTSVLFACGRHHHVRDGEEEHRALVRDRLDTDAAAVPLDDLAAEGQSDARALVFLTRVQPLEHLEDPLEVLRLDPDTVVGHRELPRRSFARRLDVHNRRVVRPAELD